MGTPTGSSFNTIPKFLRVAKFTTLFGIISTLRQKDKDNCSRVATVLSDKLCETENRFCTIPVSSEQRDRIKAEFFEIEKKIFQFWT